MKAVISIVNDFIGLIYPNICASCGNTLMRNEKVICTICLYELPRTRFHDDPENPVSQTFWGRVKVEGATSFFFFTKGSKFRKLIHKLKYKGQKEIGFELGRHFGAELAQSESFGKSDVLIPVPLHPKREKKRGYNQSEWIARGMAETMKIPVDTVSVYRNIANVTQTTKTRFDRWDNVADIFSVRNAENLKGKHIILVDDVVTTGSTLEACAATILQAGNVRVSIATIGFAS
ncbi:MAG: ComF family protein [Bacteroidetes bacterium]|nr:ComF family protein [Bacteroidota bacterium]